VCESGVTRRRDRERGTTRTLSPVPTHSRRSTPFVFTAPASRGEAAPRSRQLPCSATGHSDPNPTLTRRGRRRRPPRPTLASRVPWTGGGLGKGSHRGWTPRSAATSSVSFSFGFQLHFCLLIRFGSQEEDPAAL
jgi:hypothetical protein